MRRVFDLTREPRGELLRRLFQAVAHHSSSVMMVLRDDFGLSDLGRALLARLEPHLLERARSSSWPGTTLLDEQATTLRFPLSAVVLEELLTASEGLYEWQQPTLPEDPAFLREDGTPVLVSIAHEHDAFMELSNEEYESLLRMIPELPDFAQLHNDAS